jgi:hypothetical protein
LANKRKNKKLNKQLKDAFALSLVISGGVLIVMLLISLITSPTESFIIKESRISSEESKVRLCN